MGAIFSSKRERSTKEMETEKDRLYHRVGNLQVEPDWLKKYGASSVGNTSRRLCIDPRHSKINVKHQHKLISLPQAGY